jgi:hypothetical protein
MTTEYIQALGNLLATYHSDLTYIRDFHRHKNGKISTAEYFKKSPGTFKSFINEFRVARNVDKNKTDILLGLTTEWIKQKHSDNVDDFAEQLKGNGITHGKVMTSLASKILFLNNPWTILPLDNLAKKAVALKTNNYKNYLPLTDIFITNNKNEIDKLLASVDQHLTIIESDFQQEIENIKEVRHNRFVDKLLWTKGRTK